MNVTKPEMSATLLNWRSTAKERNRRSDVVDIMLESANDRKLNVWCCNPVIANLTIAAKRSIHSGQPHERGQARDEPTFDCIGAGPKERCRGHHACKRKRQNVVGLVLQTRHRKLHHDCQRNDPFVVASRMNVTKSKMSATLERAMR
jgi:hypothetical protein